MNDITITDLEHLLDIIKRPSVSHALASKLACAYYGINIDLTNNKDEVIECVSGWVDASKYEGFKAFMLVRNLFKSEE